ncbi:MAG: stage II sporulation protein M [Myxococcota bacterium]
MRTRQHLVAERGQHWTDLETLVHRAEGVTGSLSPEEVSTLATEYRGLASDLLQVRRDRLGADLERHLDGLAARAHNVLYSGARRSRGPLSFLELVLDFPGAVRRNLAFFMLASVLFYGPFILGGWAAFVSESYALAILDPTQLQAMEEMYSQEPSRAASGQNASMTGFYIWNNVGIAFRCFATGILFGLGSIWFLVFNGLFIGVVFGHLHRVGLGTNLLTFVATHSPWELTAIVMSGAAGLQMGLALVATQGRSRLKSLQAVGPELLRQVVGAALFLMTAAFLEAWVSPSSLPASVKAGIGAAGTLCVVLILVLGGRGRRPSDLTEPP